MAPTWVKLIFAAMLLVCFVSQTSGVSLDIDCSNSPAKDKPCPAYCPKGVRPKKLNPSSLWGVPCVCCLANKPETPGDDDNEDEVAFQPLMAHKKKTPKEVSASDRKRLLDVLEGLAKSRTIPRKEFDFWKIKIDASSNNLLTREEEDMFVQLLVDSGIPWNNAFMFVHPLAGDQGLPLPRTYSQRAGFGEEGDKEAQKAAKFSLKDLQEVVKDVNVAKVKKQ